MRYEIKLQKKCLIFPVVLLILCITFGFILLLIKNTMIAAFGISYLGALLLSTIIVFVRRVQYLKSKFTYDLQDIEGIVLGICKPDCFAIKLSDIKYVKRKKNNLVIRSEYTTHVIPFVRSAKEHEMRLHELIEDGKKHKRFDM